MDANERSGPRAVAGLCVGRRESRGGHDNCDSQAAGSRSRTDVRSWHVQGNVWLINAGTVNVAIQVGDDGVLVVDTGTDAVADRILAEIQRVAPEASRFATSSTRTHIPITSAGT